MLKLVDNSTDTYWQFTAYCDHDTESVSLGPYLKEEGAWQAMAAIIADIEQAFRCCPRCKDWVSIELEWVEKHRLCYQCIKDIREAKHLKNLGENPIPEQVAAMLYKQVLNLDDPTPLWFPGFAPLIQAGAASE